MFKSHVVCNDGRVEVLVLVLGGMSQSMQSAAEPMLGRRRGTTKRDEARAAHRFLAVAACCFVACSAAICMRAGRIAASYLEPVRLLDATP